MVYSVVPTSVTGDLWTAANHNTYIRDNFASGVPDIFTAAGDIPYATGLNTADVLPIGGVHQALVVNDAGNAPKWGSIFAGCNVWLTSTQSIPGRTDTKVVFDTETYDTDSLWSTDNTDAITIPWDGVYQCSGFVDFNSSTGTGIYIEVSISGITTISIDDANSSTDTVISFCYINRFAAGTDVFLEVAQSDTDALNLNLARYQVSYLGTST